ncbi:hypothetical protein A9Q95_12260 [Rhodobacterales bacterium 59_46_T64]|nr:hypothetical protein A9Q95_12260 [Rhodobacterales bacterium 59_46_T64]
MSETKRSVVIDVYTDSTKSELVAEMPIINGGMSMNGEPFRPATDDELIASGKLHFGFGQREIDPEDFCFVVRQ